jgi:CDP-diacylglycerol--glycerol-3-phosphate 3-phosphatidyltransferase
MDPTPVRHTDPGASGPVIAAAGTAGLWPARAALGVRSPERRRSQDGAGSTRRPPGASSREWYQGLYGLKPRFGAALAAPADWLAARRVDPDGLTAAGVGCALAAGLCLAATGLGAWTALLAAPLALARLTFNALDGLVARRTGTARPWGAVVNELGDRVADLGVFAGLALVPGAAAALVGGAAAASLLSSLVGVASEAAGGRRVRGGPMGKADRMAWVAVAALASGVTGDLAFLRLLPAVVLAGAVATLLLRLWEAHGALESAR